MICRVTQRKLFDRHNIGVANGLGGKYCYFIKITVMYQNSLMISNVMKILSFSLDFDHVLNRQ